MIKLVAVEDVKCHQRRDALAVGRQFPNVVAVLTLSS